MESPDARYLTYLFAGEQLYRIPDTTATKPLATEPIDKPVALPVVAKPLVPTVEEPLPYNPKHQVLIVVATLSVAEKALLTKILAAVNLQMNQVDILNLSEIAQADLRAVLTQKSLQQLITFGVSLFKIKLEIPLTPYQVRAVQGIKFLYADPLEQIDSDVALKRALWTALKQMFS